MSIRDLTAQSSRQYGRLCWLGLPLTGDRAQAEDLAQEALLRTYWM